MTKRKKEREEFVSRFMTVDEVAIYLRVSPDTVYRYRNKGLLIAAAVSKKPLLFDREEIDKFMDERKEQAIKAARKEMNLDHE